MLELRWIAIRDHQSRLLAEADADRLVRRAREARANDGSAPAYAATLATSEARAHYGHRLIIAAAGFSAPARQSAHECPEA